MTPSTNYYEVLGIDEDKVKVLQIHNDNDSVSEYINVGAGVGGGFTNTNELGVMKYHEAGYQWSRRQKMESRKWLKVVSLRKSRLGIPIFGSDFWDPHRKGNSGSVSDSEDSGRKNFNRIPLLKNREIGTPIPKFGIPKKINVGIQYFSFCE